MNHDSFTRNVPERVSIRWKIRTIHAITKVIVNKIFPTKLPAVFQEKWSVYTSCNRKNNPCRTNFYVFLHKNWFI